MVIIVTPDQSENNLGLIFLLTPSFSLRYNDHNKNKGENNVITYC